MIEKWSKFNESSSFELHKFKEFLEEIKSYVQEINDYCDIIYLVFAVNNKGGQSGLIANLKYNEMSEMVRFLTNMDINTIILDINIQLKQEVRYNINVLDDESFNIIDDAIVSYKRMKNDGFDCKMNIINSKITLKVYYTI